MYVSVHIGKCIYIYVCVLVQTTLTCIYITYVCICMFTYGLNNMYICMCVWTHSGHIPICVVFFVAYMWLLRLILVQSISQIFDNTNVAENAS
jgi:hypothetical protein